MSTRFYFESSGQAALTPSSWSAGWNGTGTATPLPLSNATQKRSTSGSSLTRAGGGTSGNFYSNTRWVSSPLKAQTISGTVKGQIRCSETNATDNYTIAIAIKLVKPDGTDRAVLLAVSASDNTAATPPEMATSLTNRRFQDSAESASLALTSQSASNGDVLVVEIGIRQASTSVANSTIHVCSDSGSDLAENDTATAADNPWIEFSGDIAQWPVYWFGSAANPADNGSLGEPQTGAEVTPPSGMLAGDLVIMTAVERTSGTNNITLNNNGGQSWSIMANDGSSTANANQSHTQFCEFNGTWSANPSWNFANISTTQSCGIILHVFRGATGWSTDVAATKANFASPSSPFTVSITPKDPSVAACIHYAGWFVGIANTWSSLAGAAWQNCGDAQYRNTVGNGYSSTFAYTFTDDGTQPATVSKNDSTNVAGGTLIGCLKGTIAGTTFNQSVLTATTPVPTLAAAKVFGRSVLTTTTPVPSDQMQIGKLVRTTTTPVPTLVKSLARSLLVTTSPVASLLKSLARALRTATTPVPTLAASKVKLQSVLTSTTPVGALVRAVGKLVQITTTPVPSLARSLARALLTSTSPLPSVVRSLGKLVLAVVSPVPTLDASKISGGGFPVSLLTSTSPVATVTASRAFLRSVLTSTTPVPTVAALRAFLRSLLTSTTPVPTLGRAVGKLVQIATTPVASVRLLVGKALAASTTPVASLVRAVGKLVRTSTTPVPSLAALRVVLRSLLTSTTPVATLGRMLGKLVQVATTPVAALRRAVGKLVQITTTPVPRLARGVGLVLAAMTTPVASIARGVSIRLQAFGLAVPSLLVQALGQLQVDPKYLIEAAAKVRGVFGAFVRGLSARAARRFEHGGVHVRGLKPDKKRDGEE